MLPPVGGRSFGPIGGSNPEQVRIEQHFSIRIAPGGPVMPPDMMDDLMDERPERFEEKAMGKCFASGAVLGVQSAEGNRLLLFMRDQHIISAVLEKACRARDFYSALCRAQPGRAGLRRSRPAAGAQRRQLPYCPPARADRSALAALGCISPQWHADWAIFLTFMVHCD
jgi:hypothetical protein